MYKLKVGGHTFEVVQKDPGDDLGETDFETGTIFIHSKCPRSIKEATLIHEVLHIANPTMDATPDGHRLIEALSEQLYQMFSDNLLINFDSVLGRDN